MLIQMTLLSIDSQTPCSNNKTNRVVSVLGFIIFKIDLLILIIFYSEKFQTYKKMERIGQRTFVNPLPRFTVC